jgi:hypothetical protein
MAWHTTFELFHLSMGNNHGDGHAHRSQHQQPASQAMKIDGDYFICLKKNVIVILEKIKKDKL